MEKMCRSCKHQFIDSNSEPCSKCWDSFCGKKFSQPSEWESNGFDELKKGGSEMKRLSKTLVEIVTEGHGALCSKECRFFELSMTGEGECELFDEELFEGVAGEFQRCEECVEGETE